MVMDKAYDLHEHTKIWHKFASDIKDTFNGPNDEQTREDFAAYILLNEELQEKILDHYEAVEAALASLREHINGTAPPSSDQ